MAKQNFYYVIPLLTLLSLSPAKLLENKPSRSLASVEVIAKESLEKEEAFPLFSVVAAKIDSSKINLETVTLESTKEKSLSLNKAILKEQESLNNKSSEQDKIDSLVMDALIFEKEVEVLDQRKELSEEVKKELLAQGKNHKELIEKLLVDFSAKDDKLEPAKDAEIADIQEKKEKEEEPKTLVEEKKEDTCEASEKVNVLTAQVEKLMEQQNLILQTMLNLSQAMANMTQNMQQQPYFPVPQTAYQYSAPMAQGNWVYHPQGFQPQASQGFYPEQAQQNMQQPMQRPDNWNMQPSTDLQFTPPALPQMTVGEFGMSNPALVSGFNMSSQNSLHF